MKHFWTNSLSNCKWKLHRKFLKKCLLNCLQKKWPMVRLEFMKKLMPLKRSQEKYTISGEISRKKFGGKKWNFKEPLLMYFEEIFEKKITLEEREHPQLFFIGKLLEKMSLKVPRNTLSNRFCSIFWMNFWENLWKKNMKGSLMKVLNKSKAIPEEIPGEAIE